MTDEIGDRHGTNTDDDIAGDWTGLSAATGKSRAQTGEEQADDRCGDGDVDPGRGRGTHHDQQWY